MITVFLFNILFYFLALIILALIYRKEWILEGIIFFNSFGIFFINGFFLYISGSNYIVYLISLFLTSFLTNRLLLNNVLRRDTYVLFMSLGKTKYEYIRYFIIRNIHAVVVDFIIFSFINAALFIISSEIKKSDPEKWRYFGALYLIGFLSLTIVYFFKIYNIKKREK